MSAKSSLLFLEMFGLSVFDQNNQSCEHTHCWSLFFKTWFIWISRVRRIFCEPKCQSSLLLLLEPLTREPRALGSYCSTQRRLSSRAIKNRTLRLFHSQAGVNTTRYEPTNPSDACDGSLSVNPDIYEFTCFINYCLIDADASSAGWDYWIRRGMCTRGDGKDRRSGILDERHQGA